MLILGSVPLIIIGYIFYTTGLIDYLRNNLKIVAWTTLLFGILLFFADRSQIKNKIDTSLNYKSILIIGLFQVLSIIPGVSRSGIVITASRFLNFDRVDSSKIAFYLSIPALAGARFLSIKDILETSIDFNLKFFVYYRIFLALILFVIVYA